MDDCHCPDKIGVCPSDAQRANNPEAVSLGGLAIRNDLHDLLRLVSNLVAIFIAFGKTGIKALVVRCIITLLKCLRVML